MIKDLVGLSKPLEKLIDCCATGLGKVTEPRHIKKMVDAKVYEIDKVTQALVESKKKLRCNTTYENGEVKFLVDKKTPIPVLPNNEALEKEITSYDYLTIAEDLDNRISHKELKRERNIYSTLSHTIDEVESIPEEEVSDESIDEDWITRFFNTVEDINNEKLQMLWGKILAGEIKQPNTYSLRTLDLLKNLTFKEAEIFNKVARFVIQDLNQTNSFILSDNNILSKFGITVQDILKLQELDLMNPNRLGFDSDQRETDCSSFLITGNELIQIDLPANNNYTLSVFSLTSIGSELLNLVEKVPNSEYKKELSIKIKSNNDSIKVFSNSTMRKNRTYDPTSNIEI